MESQIVRTARLQDPCGDKIRCNVCERRCLIAKGGLGMVPHTPESRGQAGHPHLRRALFDSGEPDREETPLPFLSRLAHPHRRQLVVQLWLPVVSKRGD